jgi:hypothetical protein
VRITWPQGADVSLWRVEIPGWSRLQPDRQREFLILAGDFGGEWWGEGCVLVPGVADAHRLSHSARVRGFFVNMRLESMD